MDVIIGIDPHKSSHTAVAIDRTEQVLDQVRLVAGRCQLDQLLAFAGGGPSGAGRSSRPPGSDGSWRSSW